MIKLLVDCLVNLITKLLSGESACDEAFHELIDLINKVTEIKQSSLINFHSSDNEENITTELDKYYGKYSMKNLIILSDLSFNKSISSLSSLLRNSLCGIMSLSVKVSQSLDKLITALQSYKLLKQLSLSCHIITYNDYLSLSKYLGDCNLTDIKLEILIVC